MQTNQNFSGFETWYSHVGCNAQIAIQTYDLKGKKKKKQKRRKEKKRKEKMMKKKKRCPLLRHFRK